MEVILISILALVYFASGVYSAVFWYTFKNDLIADLNVVLTMVLAGFLGPFSWLIGKYVYAITTHRIILKRRSGDDLFSKLAKFLKLSK